MSYGKGALLAVIIAILAVTVVASVPSEAATAKDMSSGDVTFIVFSDDIDINTAEEFPISIHLHNAHATPVTVKLTDDGNSVIKLSLTDNIIMLDEGESKEIDAKLVTDRYTSKGNYTITFVMSVMNGVDAPTESTLPVDVSITSNYSSGEKYNRFFGLIDNDLPEPFNTANTATIVTLMGWVGIAILVASFFLLVLKGLFKVIERDPETLGRNTLIGVFACVVLFGIENCLYISGVNEIVVDQYTRISNTLYILFAAFVIWDIYKALVTSALQKLEKKGVEGMDTSLIPLFLAIGRIFIVVMVIAIILSTFGVNFVTLITSAGLAGLGLSFGVKPAINELFSGLVVLMTRPFKIGDYVTVGTDDRLKVTEIGILRTKFETGYSPEAATMPNSKIASSKIVNISHNTTKFRNTVSVKVPFDSNLTLIKKIAKRVAMDHPNGVTDGSVPKPNAVFSACEDGSAIIVTLAFYVRDYEVNLTTACQIREGILNAFRERDIIIPYNKMEVTIFRGGRGNAQ